jgi:hypothetical protein
LEKNFSPTRDILRFVKKRNKKPICQDGFLI